MNVLVALECSGIVRDAFIAAGHTAMSCDLKPTRRPGPHYQGDVRDVLDGKWDLMIAHPECTRLSNSGVQWLTRAPKGRTLDDIWREFEEGIRLYEVLRNAPIERKALENPVMNPYARERLGNPKRHIVQPWWFGERERSRRLASSLSGCRP